MPMSNEQFRQAHFRCFARNGRWGTCVDCPKDSEGHIYPEFCENTDRYDHQLDVDALAEQQRIREKEDRRAKQA